MFSQWFALSFGLDILNMQRRPRTHDAGVWASARKFMGLGTYSWAAGSASYIPLARVAHGSQLQVGQ